AVVCGRMPVGGVGDRCLGGGIGDDDLVCLRAPIEHARLRLGWAVVAAAVVAAGVARLDGLSESRRDEGAGVAALGFLEGSEIGVDGVVVDGVLADGVGRCRL